MTKQKIFDSEELKDSTEDVLLLQAKESLKVNASKICGKLKIYQEKKRQRLNLSEVHKQIVKGNTKEEDQPTVDTGNILISPKEEQSIKTLKWLEENFIRCPGVCLPRCIMYAHYLSFCQEHKFRPACAATFGKIIRQKFPELTTRRLGTRGNSKYHYYGVAIKESSTYYHTVYSGRGLTRFSGSKFLSENDASRKIMTSAKSGTLLPEFPSPSQLILPDHVEISKMDTFMIMYRTHCQCILDTAVAKNFQGIQTYLVHFWHGIPKHLKSLFDVDEIIDLVCICDSIMYMVLNDILVPASLEEITDESLKEVRGFVGEFEKSLSHGLSGCNKNLLERKLNVARRFVQSVKRQSSFLHLAKSFREVLSDKTISSNLLTELDTIDIKSIGAQAVYTTVDCTQDQTDLHEQYFSELRELLRAESPVEAYIEWLENIFKTQVLRDIDLSDFVAFKLRAQQFLLSWSFFVTRVTHMLTLNNSRTYGPFHLIRMMLDEYLFLITETKSNKQARKELQTQSEKLIKGTSDHLKISKVVTKSKFGAPSKRKQSAYQGKTTVGKLSATSRRSNGNKQNLPSIAKIFTSKNTNQLTAMNHKLLPDDPFTKRYGNLGDASFSSVMSLTPPSSPLATDGIFIESGKECIETVTENVDNLVDEHFRNCGIENISQNAKGKKSMVNSEQNDIAGFIQKFLQSQNQMMDPYEVNDDMFFQSTSDDEENQPLQCSFSQILKGGDVFFSDHLLNDTLPMSSDTMNNNNNINKNTASSSNLSTAQAFSNLVSSMNLDNFLETTNGMSSHLYLGVDDDDDEFNSINSKALQLSF